MSKISIDVEREWYYPGEVVRGTVHVHEDAAKATSLEVSLWHEGKHVASTERGKLRLAEGAVRAGDAFPFELTIPPDAPTSFEGHKLSLGWYAWAILDVPWAVDPRAKQVFELRPLAIEGPQEHANWKQRLAESKPDESEAAELSGCAKVIVYPIFVILALMLLPIAIPVLIPFGLLFWTKSALIKTRLRELKLEVPEGPFALGEWIPVELSFQLRKPVRVEKLTLTLKGQEHWVTRSNKNTHHHYHTFHEDELDLTGDRVLAPTSEEPGTVRARAHLEVPRRGLPTVTKGKAVFYTLTGRVWLVGWPDPSEASEPCVVGARVADLPAPPPPDLDGSEGIVQVPQGSPAPAGVDVSVARESVWFFLLLPFLGLGLVAADVGLWAANGRDLARELSALLGVGLLTSDPFVFTAVGVLMTLTGVAGIAWKVTR